ncbi:MAG: hypothetical protein IPL78_10005 [Chloroflexi bacterium]|nr:hypothetical protein [Chloroflexota bacterium]
MQSLAEDDLGYFNDAKTWRSGPSFHAVLVQKNQTPSMKLIDSIMSDEFVLEWNVMSDLVTQNEVKYCIISVPALINPVGAKLFQRTYDHYSLLYISIPTHHMERICGTRWAFGQFDLDQIVALHNTLIHLCQKNCRSITRNDCIDG